MVVVVVVAVVVVMVVVVDSEELTLQAGQMLPLNIGWSVSSHPSPSQLRQTSITHESINQQLIILFSIFHNFLRLKIGWRNVWSMKWRIPDQQVDQRGLDERLFWTCNSSGFPWPNTSPSVLWRCWLGGRKGIWPVKNWVVGCWHGWWDEVHIANRCHCHSLSLAPVNPDWF